MKKVIFWVTTYYLAIAMLAMGWMQVFPDIAKIFSEYQFAFWFTHGVFFGICLCIGGYNDWYRN